jgi:hypothetical protein
LQLTCLGSPLESDPLVDLGLFSDRAFRTAAATLTFGIFVLWGSNYAIVQYLPLRGRLKPSSRGRSGLTSPPRRTSEMQARLQCLC